MVDFMMRARAARRRQAPLLGERGSRLAKARKTPFLYGYARDPSACNIDNPYISPSLSKIYDTNQAVAGAELERLDQGVPSGDRPRCKSGFGVHDQTGNVDEWVMLEKKRGEGGWAGLKGGGWGHVRNACRPVTTSHAPEFTLLFYSFAAAPMRSRRRRARAMAGSGATGHGEDAGDGSQRVHTKMTRAIWLIFSFALACGPTAVRRTYDNDVAPTGDPPAIPSVPAEPAPLRGSLV
jgi:hypothetical protein